MLRFFRAIIQRTHIDLAILCEAPISQLHKLSRLEIPSYPSKHTTKSTATMSGYSSYKYTSKAIIHQAEPSLSSDYAGSDYSRSSRGSYSSSTSSGASTPRTTHSYSTESYSYTARDYAAKDRTMTVHPRGNVVVINRQHPGHEPGAPISHQLSWANRDKSKK